MATRSNLFHGRVGAGLTLTLDMAVGRVLGVAGNGKGVKKKRAKAGNEICAFFSYRGPS